MNKVYKFVNTFESYISDKILEAYDSKDELKEIELSFFFHYIWEITSKFNFINKKKLYNCFVASLPECDRNERIDKFYKYICACLCGVKKNWKTIDFSGYVQDIIGFERTGNFR